MKNAIIILVLFFMAYVPLTYVLTTDLKKFIGINFIIFTVVATLAGFTEPNITIYLVTLLLLFLSTVRSEIDSVCRYILIAAVVPEISISLGASGHYFGVIDSVAVLGLAAYLAGKVYQTGTPGRSGFAWTTEDFLVLTVFLINTVGAIGLSEITSVIRGWTDQFMSILLPYLVFKTCLRTKSDFRLAVACFGVASVFLAVFAIYEARMSWSIFEAIGVHLGVPMRMSKNTLIRGGALRASATMGGPLALACFMTVGIFALTCSRDFFKNTIGFYGCLAVAFMGLLASQSRGSMICLFASSIVLSLALRKRGIAAASAAVGMAVWPTLLFLANVSPWVAGFMNGGAKQAPGQYHDYRNDLLTRGLQEAAKHPIIGLRLSQVVAALADITQGEHIVDLVNVYLVFLLISGIVGLLPFLALTLTSVGRATTGFKRINDPSMLRMRGFCLAAITVVLLQFSFVSFIDRIPMNFGFILCGISILVFERQSRRKNPANAPAGYRSSPPAAQWIHADGRYPDGDTRWAPKLPADPV